MSWNPNSGRSTKSRFHADLNEYVANWFSTPTEHSDVVDIVLERPCACGSCLGEAFRTTRYGRVFGPVYWGETTLASYAGWDRLIASERATAEERLILVAMSENEGKMDAVQSYDSEILTAGAMQKTINPEGGGEFPKQVLEFKHDHPKLHEKLFSKCGWEVSADDEPTMRYQGMTGAALKLFIRDGFTEENFRTSARKRSPPLAAVVNAITTMEFQEKQVVDFIGRLRKVMEIKPHGSSSRAIGDYVKSNFGKAALLDQHVNRPGYVSRDFGKALKLFHTGNPDAPKAPEQWNEQHSANEAKLLDIYGDLREMTDSTKRFEALRKKL
ncbi:MAG: hypothetical protein ACREO4_07035 [Lysobacter sp.]